MKNLLAVQYCDLDNLEDFLGWILGRLHPVDSKGMAERVGFEPTVRFPARSLSRRVLSTAQPPLRGRSTPHFSREMMRGLCPPAWNAWKGFALIGVRRRKTGLRRRNQRLERCL